MRSLRRYAALAPSDRWDLVRAFAWLTLVHVGLRTIGFDRLVHHLQARFGCSSATDTPDTHRRAHRYAHWLDVAARHHLIQAHCLHRSLALHEWLRSEGLSSDLRIGVCKRSGELKAHAWIELNGCVVNDRPSVVAAFTPLTNPVERLATAIPRASVMRAWQ